MGQFPKMPSSEGMDSYSQGTEVDIKAPTQRSLCFFLWFMYCKILREGKALVMQWMLPSLEFAPRAVDTMRSRWDLHLLWDSSATPSSLGSGTLFSHWGKGRQGAQTGQNMSFQNCQAED